MSSHIFSSFIYSMLLFHCLCTNVLWTSNRNKFVRNITVHVLENEIYNNKNDTDRFLRLNISWLPPISNIQPSSYSIIVTSISREKDIETAVCPNGSFYYNTQNKYQLSAVIPENTLEVDMPEMYIYPSCSYEIQVFANPRRRLMDKAQAVIYRVPECVGRKCNCVNVKSLLPIPHVDITQENNYILIKWNVNNNSLVHSYIISIGIPLLTSNAGLPVYNVTKIGITSANAETFLWEPQKYSHFDELIDGHRVSVAASDSHGCLGAEGAIIMNSQYNSTLHRNIIWMIFVGFIISCILTMIYIKKKQQLWWKPPNNLRTQSMLSIPKCTSNWINSVLYKRNILYTEHNVEEKLFKRETDMHEISYDSLKFICELGKGQFGKVYLGYINNEETPVAVKVSQHINNIYNSHIRKEFMEEIEIMKKAGQHPHLVSLIGYCTVPNKPICIILEYMKGGSLLTYLHSKRNNKENQIKCASNVPQDKSPQQCLEYITLKTEKKENEEKHLENTIERSQFLQFALDIAKGMKYLESKNITHRDLAARNVLLTSNIRLKISDFGLSRKGIYIINNIERPLPIRWMAPETLTDRMFSLKSDVWSFGVILWEIGTLGEFPYAQIPDHELLNHIVCQRQCLQKRKNIPNDIYKIMQCCWAFKSKDRPTFAQLVLDLQTLTRSISVQIRRSTHYMYSVS